MDVGLCAEERRFRGKQGPGERLSEPEQMPLGVVGPSFPRGSGPPVAGQGRLPRCRGVRSGGTGRRGPTSQTC